MFLITNQVKYTTVKITLDQISEPNKMAKFTRAFLPETRVRIRGNTAEQTKLEMV